MQLPSVVLSSLSIPEYLRRNNRPLFYYLSSFSSVFFHSSLERVVGAIHHKWVGIWDLQGNLHMELLPPPAGQRAALDVIAIDQSELADEIAVVRESTVGPEQFYLTLYYPNNPTSSASTWSWRGESSPLVQVVTSRRHLWTYDREKNQIRGYLFSANLKQKTELWLSDLVPNFGSEEKVTRLERSAIAADGSYFLRLIRMAGPDVVFTVHPDAQLSLVSSP